MKYIIIIVLTLGQFVFTQINSPKREFRGAWVATVSNLDWPTTKNNTTQQYAEMRFLFDTLQRSGLNAVIFQVRPACDAFYVSTIEPWSYWLTGTQGLAPSPAYDPLAFAVYESHKRGMEIHAWFNPYRAINGTYTLAANHVMNQHPEWILTVGAGQKKILNPGLQAVREFVLSVIMDVVRRYDIDGVHMDDYFYPYPSDNITTEDTATFSMYPRGFTNIANWRRDNINILISAIMDSINAVKPHVKFGMSPFGIWKNGVPAGITGLDAYSSIYCDAISWIQNQDIDYLTPQLYWKIGGSQDYLKLQRWWADSVYKYQRHFYPGQSFGSGYTNLELPTQIDSNRTNRKVGGQINFRAGQIKSNNLGFRDSLQTRLYKYPAIAPVMPWKDNIKPNIPTNLTASNILGSVTLQWTKPSSASDGDLAKRFVLYRSLTSSIDTSSSKNIIFLSVNDTTKYTDLSATAGVNYYYTVTALDECGNESGTSNVVMINAGNDNTILADFESGLGLFDRPPTYSGSTRGLSGTSTSARVTTQFYGGAASLQLVLIDNAASTDNWIARILSGSGTVSNNTPLPPTGNINFWLKTSTAPTGSQVAITIDDTTSGTELSYKLDIINDGAWHNYSFDFQAAGWTSYAGGNGVVNGPLVTLDAIMFYAPNNSPNWTIFLDNVSYNSTGTPLPVQLSEFYATIVKSDVLLKWATKTEVNNYGFEIERKPETSTEWEKIGFIYGNGNSNSEKYYTFTDKTDDRQGTTNYRLKQIDNDGNFEYSEIIAVLIPAAEISLLQNYPNPFNPRTTINYQLREDGFVSLKVFDILGREVKTLINENIRAGKYSVEFDAATVNGGLSSGIYFYILETGNFRAIKKMQFIK